MIYFRKSYKKVTKISRRVLPFYFRFLPVAIHVGDGEHPVSTIILPVAFKNFSNNKIVLFYKPGTKVRGGNE